MDSVRRYVYKAGTTPLGGQDLINLDPFARPFFHATFNVDLVSGTMLVQPEFTTDFAESDPAIIRWLPYGPQLTDSTLVSIDHAVTAVRLNILSISGEVRLAVCHGLNY